MELAPVPTPALPSTSLLSLLSMGERYHWAGDEGV